LEYDARPTAPEIATIVKQLRVLIASFTRSVVGGAERYVRSLIPALRDEGHEVGFLFEVSAPPGALTIDPAGRGVALFPGDGDVPSALRAVEAWAPDVVYVQGLHSPELEAAIIGRWPAVLFAHGYYGTCVTGTKRYAVPAIRACTRRFGPGCLLRHYPRRCGGLSPLTEVALYRVQARRNALLARFRAVVVASHHMYEEFARHGVPGARLFVAPLPPPEIAPDPEAPPRRTPAGRILFLGRLIRDKGVAVLMDALPLAGHGLGRELSLVVAGLGPEAERLMAQARVLGLGVEFPGWVDGAARTELLRRADLVAVPSLWTEPFGLVGIEAGCVGVPAVGFATGGIREWLRPGETGELAASDPPTAKGLAAAIVRAICDEGYYARLCVGAWEAARSRTMKSHLAALEPAFAVATT
jgi:glycosyltransferase involved in cell wall biosynthesis